MVKMLKLNIGNSSLANKPNMSWEKFDEIYFSTDLDQLIKIGIEDGYLQKMEEKPCEMFDFHH